MAGTFGWDEKREGYYCNEITGAWEIPKKQRRAFENLLRSQDEAKPKLLPPPYSGPNPGADATAFLEDDDGN
jgi:hypothetical protein